MDSRSQCIAKCAHTQPIYVMCKIVVNTSQSTGRSVHVRTRDVMSIRMEEIKSSKKLMKNSQVNRVTRVTQTN